MNNDLDLEVGDKLQYKCNGEIHTLVIGDKHDLDLYNEHNEFLELEILKIERPKYETIYEKKEILDEAEKEYLSNVIRPFKDKINFIFKSELCSIKEEFIVASLRNGYDSFRLPYFKEGTMYKGMKSMKHYTLKELGLE